MSQSKLIRFSRSPIAIRIAGSEGANGAIPMPAPETAAPAPKRRVLDPRAAEEAAAAKAAADAAIEDAYKRGYEAAYRELNEEKEALKARLSALEEQTIKRLEAGHEDLMTQMGCTLPKLVMVAVKRVLPKLEIPAETVAAIVDELLQEVHPGSGALEIILSEQDLAALEANHASTEDFKQRYPGITFRTDPKMVPGDCLLKSRFGTIDGRISTKMDNLEDLLQ